MMSDIERKEGPAGRVCDGPVPLRRATRGPGLAGREPPGAGRPPLDRLAALAVHALPASSGCEVRPGEGAFELAARRPERRAQEPLVARPAGERFDLKARQAQRLLVQLNPRDPRLRLVTMALLRRDEVLLDAVVRRLASGRARPPARRG